MIELKLQDKNPIEILNMVHDLRAYGVVQGVDFDFEFHPSTFVDNKETLPSFTIFKFYTESWASWFLLRSQ